MAIILVERAVVVQTRHIFIVCLAYCVKSGRFCRTVSCKLDVRNAQYFVTCTATAMLQEHSVFASIHVSWFWTYRVVNWRIFSHSTLQFTVIVEDTEKLCLICLHSPIALTEGFTLSP